MIRTRAIRMSQGAHACQSVAISIDEAKNN